MREEILNMSEEEHMKFKIRNNSNVAIILLLIIITIIIIIILIIKYDNSNMIRLVIKIQQ